LSDRFALLIGGGRTVTPRHQTLRAAIDWSYGLLHEDEQVFVLEVTGLPELSEGEIYQAWLFQEDVPIPVGVMNAGTESFAVAGDRDNLELFCVTVEQGPLGSPAPTSDPILVASLQGSDPS
jgi:hypothetical protein